MALIIDVTGTTDTGDILAIDINADGIELLAGAAIDDVPTGDTEILSVFEAATPISSPDEVGNIGPFGFTDTIVVDVDCTSTTGDVDYQVFAFFEAPSAAVITPTENIP